MNYGCYTIMVDFEKSENKSSHFKSDLKINQHTKFTLVLFKSMRHSVDVWKNVKKILS
jgi:hypothetical protein